MGLLADEIINLALTAKIFEGTGNYAREPEKKMQIFYMVFLSGSRDNGHLSPGYWLVLRKPQESCTQCGAVASLRLSDPLRSRIKKNNHRGRLPLFPVRNYIRSNSNPINALKQRQVFFCFSPRISVHAIQGSRGSQVSEVMRHAVCSLV